MRKDDADIEGVSEQKRKGPLFKRPKDSTDVHIERLEARVQELEAENKQHVGDLNSARERQAHWEVEAYALQAKVQELEREVARIADEMNDDVMTVDTLVHRLDRIKYFRDQLRKLLETRG